MRDPVGDSALECDRSNALAALFGIVIVAVVVLPGFEHDLWNPDEPRVAHIAQHILESGDWLVPTVNGRPFIEKPPLQAWCIAAFASVLGEGYGKHWVARLPSMLFALATLALVARSAMRIWRPRVALLSVVFLATTVEFFVGFQRAIVDTSLSFFVTLAMLQLVEAHALGGSRRDWLRRALLVGLGIGFAFLAKNLIGVVFIALVASALLVRRWRVLLRPDVSSADLPCGHVRRGDLLLALAVSIGTALLIALAWLVPFGIRSPEHLETLLVDNTIGRFTSSGFHNPNPFDFVHRAVGVLMPWVPAAMVGAWMSFRVLISRAPRDESASGAALVETRAREAVVAWFVLPTLFVLVSGSKREIYLLPVTPAVALLAAVVLARQLEARWFRRAALAIFALLAPAVPLAAFLGGAFSGEISAVGWAFGVLGLAVLVRVVRSRGRLLGVAPVWVSLLLALCALGLGSSIFYGGENARQSYVPLARKLDELRASGHEIVGYQLPLRDECAVAYYGRGSFENFTSDEDALARYRDAERPCAVVMRERGHEDFLRSIGPFRRAGSFTVRRRILVFTNMGPRDAADSLEPARDEADQ